MFKRVGVVGAGQMGSGIAQVCAAAGSDVILLDVDQGRLDAALDGIAKALERQVAKGRLDETAKAVTLTRIVPALDYKAFADVEVVIEAASENEDLKRAGGPCPVERAAVAIPVPVGILAGGKSRLRLEWHSGDR